jgi:hypothetical protein
MNNKLSVSPTKTPAKPGLRDQYTLIDAAAITSSEINDLSVIFYYSLVNNS